MPRTVQEIMNHELLVVPPEMLAREARDLLRSYAVGAAPVVSDQWRPLGVLALGDLLDAEGTASDRMTRPALCAPSSLSVAEAARLIASAGAHYLVAVDAVGAAVGMLSAVDLLRALLEMPTPHPHTFPHWDGATETSWTDDWPLAEENVMNAPAAAGVLTLCTDHLGEASAIVWVEASTDVRSRLKELALCRQPTGDPALARALALHGLRFRATHIPEDAARSRIAAMLRDRLDHLPPPGAT
jgi:CBS domain-containing protein